MPELTPYWSFDGPRMSAYCLDGSRGVEIIGSALLSENGEWVAWNNTTNQELGRSRSRDEVKNLIVKAFEPPTPEDPDPRLKADFIQEQREAFREVLEVMGMIPEER